MAGGKAEFTKTEIKAGFLVISSLLVLGVFVAAVTGWRPPQASKTFNAFFGDTGGLNSGADVRFGGVKVGRVIEIEPAPGVQSQIRIVVRISDSTPVNARSTAYITQTTLTSEKHVEITTGEDGAALLDDGADIPQGAGGLFGQVDAVAGGLVGVLEDVRTLIGVVDEDRNPAMKTDERKTVAEVMVAIRDVVGNVQELVGVEDAEGKPRMTAEEQRTVAEIFTTVDDTIGQGRELVGDIQGVVGDSKDDIEAIMAKVREISDSAHKLIGDLDSVLAENRDAISGAVTDVKHITGTVSETMDGLAAQIDELAELLRNTLVNVESISGEARILIEQNGPAIEDIIIDSREMVRNLKEFSRTLADEPQSVVRGKSPEGRP